MPFSQQDADRTLRNARAFYKGGSKSANKIYPVDKAVATGDTKGLKMFQRTLTANEVNLKLERVREHRPGMTVADYGWHLYMKELTEGNCAEMNSVVASLLRQTGLVSKDDAKMFWMDVNPPGDHNFIVVSSDGSSPDWANISGMRVSTGNFWAIDCWLNVACPAGDYPRRISEKLAKWASDWKQIRQANAAGDGWIYHDLGQQTYLNQLSTSRLVANAADTYRFR
jgi:arginyl-tRNA synthetase